MRRCAITILLAACAAGPNAHAQNADQPPPDESLLVTATRVPTAEEDVSAGVTIIDRATMQQRGYTTLEQALSAVAGVQIVPSGPGEATVFVRGANSNQVQVLIDGVPVNDASGPGEAYNFGVETLADVARIEVVRGPMSAVYGSGAIGGVVNIITQRGTATTDPAPQGSLTLAGGFPAALLAQGNLRGRIGGFDYNLSAESHSDAGFDATPQRESVYTSERDGIRTQLGAIDLGYTPFTATRLFVDLRGRTTVYGYDDVGYPAFDDPNETARDNDLFGRVGAQSTLFGGIWQTGLEFSHDQEYRNYVNLLDADDPNGAQENSTYVGLRSDLQFNNTIALPDTALSRGGAVTAGYEHIDAEARERLNSAYFGVPYLASVNASDRRESGYLGAQDTLFGRATLTANLREEAVSGVGDAFTWRAGASYALPGLASHIKASYGTAFLAPSLFDRYGLDSYGYVGNPSLRPEHSAGYEIGWSTALWHWGSADATWFHTSVHDLIETVFDPVYTSANVARARLQGVETQLHLHPAAWIDADISYTYTDARDATTGTLLLRRPYDSGAVSLVFRPLPALTVAPQITFAGGDLDAIVNNQGYPVGDGRNPGGAIANLSITWQLHPHMKLFAWGRDLNNTRYEAASGYASPRPSFLAGISVGD
jgi:vitamin B12 transporter